MKSVAVIGAGASGLTAIKCCLDEGLEPVCFERGNYIGGLWHYTKEVEEGQACVMKSTVINTSKEMMCYSDFPTPAEYPNYMHNKYVDKYFHMYADHFGLKKYINFNTEVLHVKPTKPFNSEGRWEITIKVSGKEETRLFDAVLVCTGHHAEKNVPNFAGLDKFSGNVIHAHDYKDYHGYEDKNILIIGIGNSGGDIATELSGISSQVYLSTRSGAWIFHRVDDKGLPGDTAHSTRFKTRLLKTFPSIMMSLAEKKLINKIDHEKYCLKPRYGLFSAHPTLNDELPNKIVSGGVIVKANVAEFTEKGAVFEDGTKVDDLDAVVLATGYIFGFPFIDKSVIEVKANKVNLYKYMFPPDLQKHTLAIIGCFQPIGAVMPMSEMQCRLATRVFKGLKTLPDSSEMWRDIRFKQDAMRMRYKQSMRHTIQVDYVPFITELAKMVGCNPDIIKLALTDPQLAREVYFGPCTPYQFRLMGPGSWKGARDAIMSQWERIHKPLQTRPCAKTEHKSFGVIYILIIAVIAVLLYMLL